MATKLKKSKMYSKPLKALAVAIILLLSAVTSISLVFVANLPFETSTPSMSYNSFFETDSFDARYSQLVRDVVNTTLVYKDEENIKAGNAIDHKLITSSFINNNNLDADIAGNSAEIIFNNQEDYKFYEKYFPAYKQQVIQNQLDEFENSKKNLERYSDFVFSFNNYKTGEVISNSSVEFITQQKVNSHMDGNYTNGKPVHITNNYYDYDDNGRLTKVYYYDNYLPSVSDILLQSNHTLNVAVKDELDEGSAFYNQLKFFENRKTILPIVFGIAIGSTIVSVVLLVYLLLSAGRNNFNNDITLLTIDSFYTDIHTLLFFAIAFISVYGASMLSEGIYFATKQWGVLLQGLLCCVYLFDVIVLISYTTSMARQIKAKVIFRNTLLSNVIRFIASLFKENAFRWWMVISLLVYGILNCFLGYLAVTNDTNIAIVFIVVLNVFSAFFTFRALRSLKRIMSAVKETSTGNIDYELNLDTISPSFLNFATDITNMQNGLKMAVGQALKGERMKAELITNVSHDLRTPLTSIVTYIDLLKHENIQNDTVKNYVGVLDEKAYRLKQLIDDLIEASKASSGNLPVNKNKLDLKELIMQACGEFDERIEGANLTFKISAQETVYICADGGHMWRIAENLIGNAIKYSLPSSRVYVDIIKTETDGIFVMKNVSSCPIEVPDEQLTERFVQGDTSRNFEGSGLGLSIASSLTEIQGGKITIETDGDLFKVTVKMPLWQEEI